MREWVDARDDSLRSPCSPLEAATLPTPSPGPRRDPRSRCRPAVSAAPICTSSMASLPDPKLPLVPGHEIVGIVGGAGRRRDTLWRRRCASACRGSATPAVRVAYCRSGRENLCDAPRFTGYHDRRRLRRITRSPTHATAFALPGGLRRRRRLAPWLCAGLIGYRALQHGRRRRAPRHLRLRRRCAHRRATRTCFRGTRDRSRSRGRATPRRSVSRAKLGVAWAGAAATRRAPAGALDAALIFAPVGTPSFPTALRASCKGGTVVSARGIHMSDIPSFPYSFLWGERQVVSVANLTRRTQWISSPARSEPRSDARRAHHLLCRRQRSARGAARRHADRRGGADASVSCYTWRRVPLNLHKISRQSVIGGRPRKFVDLRCVASGG